MTAIAVWIVQIYFATRYVAGETESLRAADVVHRQQDRHASTSTGK
jgi:hypothetical protein